MQLAHLLVKRMNRLRVTLRLSLHLVEHRTVEGRVLSFVLMRLMDPCVTMGLVDLAVLVRTKVAMEHLAASFAMLLMLGVAMGFVLVSMTMQSL